MRFTRGPYIDQGLLTEPTQTPPPLVLVPQVLGIPLLMYLAVHELSMGCILSQNDKSGWKEQAMCYSSKNFDEYENQTLHIGIAFVLWYRLLRDYAIICSIRRPYKFPAWIH